MLSTVSETTESVLDRDNFEFNSDDRNNADVEIKIAIDYDIFFFMSENYTIQRFAVTSDLCRREASVGIALRREPLDDRDCSNEVVIGVVRQ